MKILTRALFLVVLLGCLLAVDTPSASGEPTKKTVLVLSPFQLDLSTNLIASQALREEFGKAADLSLDVYYEYLDLNRFPDPAYQQKIFDLLTVKYKNKQVDLVIVGSESMLKLWLAQRAEILPNTPIVFFDVFTEHLDGLGIPANVTGVSGVEDCEKSVRWVIYALPGVNEIVLVGGAGKIEQGFADHIQKLQVDLAGLVKFTDLSGLTLAEIKQRAANLPKTAIVLYHPMFEDAEGNKYRPLEVLRGTDHSILRACHGRLRSVYWDGHHRRVYVQHRSAGPRCSADRFAGFARRGDRLHPDRAKREQPLYF